MSKYARKKDDNHDEIVDEFKRLGCGVKDVHDLPNFVDIIICYKSATVMVEIKDGAKPASARKLTSGEKKFSDEWIAKGGKWACIETIEQANEMIKGIKQ
jgi:hypothetical protein